MFINQKSLKRRIAVCESCFGNHSHFFIKGQVIDLSKNHPIFHFLKKTPKSPISNFFHTPVISAILKIKIKNKTKTFVENEIEADKLGFFYHHYNLELRSGTYKFEVYFQRLNSYFQYAKDIFFQNFKTHTNELIGIGNIKIFSKKPKHVFLISDIDQTYLDTKMTPKGILNTIFESPNEKITLPKMDVLYKNLQEKSKIHILFLSASPYFFKRTLNHKFKKDGLKITNIRLKYEGCSILSKEKLINLQDKFRNKDKNIIYEMTDEFIKSSLQNLLNHISYKLTELLKNRLYFPTKVEQILVGDNTEHDPLIFYLYQILLMGKLKVNEVSHFLQNIKIKNKQIFNISQIDKINQIVQECILYHGKKNTVKLILINKSKYGRDENEIKDEIISILPKNLNLNKIKNFKHFQILDGAKCFSEVFVKEKLLLNTIS